MSTLYRVGLSGNRGTLASKYEIGQYSEKQQGTDDDRPEDLVCTERKWQSGASGSCRGTFAGELRDQSSVTYQSVQDLVFGS